MFPLFNEQEMAKFLHGKGDYKGLSIGQVMKQWEQVLTINFFQKKKSVLYNKYKTEV